MKISFKDIKGIKIKKKTDKTAKAEGRKAADDQPSSDGFNVNIRNTDPIMSLVPGKKKSVLGSWGADIISSLMIAAAAALILELCEALEMLPFALAGVVVYVGYSRVKERFPGKINRITAIALSLILIVLLIVLRKYIGNGLALLANQLFEYAQYCQAYVYDMYPVGATGDNSPETCMMIAVAWCSSVVGLITALPDRKYRRLINTGIVVLLMICLIYFGILPTWLVLLALLAVFLLSFSNGRLVSTLPLLLVVVLVFGILVLVDPGENYAVSRTNENIRDRLALHSAYIESDEYMDDEFESEEEEDDSQGGLMDFLSGETEAGGKVIIYVLLAAIVLLLGAAIFFIHRNLVRKRKRIRAGLDSTDPNTAIGAMFPYAVRWLKIFGIESGAAPFSGILPEVKENMSEGYVKRYNNMLGLWQEAVYSEHTLTDTDKKDMELFMKETMKLAKDKADWKDKLRIRFKYAL